MIYSDKELSQKLERTEASANADFVETRARLFPDSGATWIEVAGAYAMFDGVESPCTQSFGNSLGVAAGFFIGERESQMRPREVRIHIDRFSELLDGLFVSAACRKKRADGRVDDQR